MAYVSSKKTDHSGEAHNPISWYQRYLLNQYLRLAMFTLRRSGFRVETSTDLMCFATFLEDADGNQGVNPTFDPRACDLSTGAFWLNLREKSGDIVACMASRLFKTKAYYDLMRNGSMWCNQPDKFRIPMATDAAGPAGRISQSGGLWVHPQWRGEGLSWIVPRTVSAMSLERWNIDFHTGVVFAELFAKGLPTRNYGVATARLCVDGYFPPTGKAERIFSVETPQSILLERSFSDLKILLFNSHRHVRDLAPIARKRD